MESKWKKVTVTGRRHTQSIHSCTHSDVGELCSSNYFAAKLLDQAKSVPHYHNEAMNWHLWIWQQLWTWHGGGLFIADADPWQTRVCPWQPGTSASWRLCAFPAEQVWGLKSRESGVRLADNMISVLQRQQEEAMGEFISLSSGTPVDMSVISWNA